MRICSLLSQLLVATTLSAALSAYAAQTTQPSLVSNSEPILLSQVSAEDYLQKGRALLDRERYQEAITAFDRAIQLQPDNYKALANRSIALYELKRYDEAIAL